MRKILRLSLCLLLAASSVQAEENPTAPTIPMTDLVAQARQEGQPPVPAVAQEPSLKAEQTPALKEPTKTQVPDLKDQTSILPTQAPVIREPKPIKPKKDSTAAFDEPVPVNFIAAEMPTIVQLSNRDINRIVCSGPMSDLIYSEEKGVTGHFSGNSQPTKVGFVGLAVGFNRRSACVSRPLRRPLRGAQRRPCSSDAVSAPRGRAPTGARRRSRSHGGSPAGARAGRVTGGHTGARGAAPLPPYAALSQRRAATPLLVSDRSARRRGGGFTCGRGRQIEIARWGSRGGASGPRDWWVHGRPRRGPSPPTPPSPRGAHRRPCSSDAVSAPRGRGLYLLARAGRGTGGFTGASGRHPAGACCPPIANRRDVASQFQHPRSPLQARPPKPESSTA